MIGAVAGRHHVVENPLRDAPLTAGIPVPQCRRLKFLHHLPQSLVRNVTSKAVLEAWTCSCRFRSSCDLVVGRYHELRKRTRANPWQDRRDATSAARSATPALGQPVGPLA